VDLEALPAPVDLEKLNENRAYADWEIITETPWKGDSWSRKGSQLLLTQRKSTKTKSMATGNHHRNTFQRWRVDSEVLAAPVDSEKLNENEVGVDWEIIIETPLKGDTWILKGS